MGTADVGDEPESDLVIIANMLHEQLYRYKVRYIGMYLKCSPKSPYPYI